MTKEKGQRDKEKLEGTKEVISFVLLFTASDYLFGTFKLLFVLLPFFFCHCIVCPSSIYGFWLPFKKKGKRSKRSLKIPKR
jgi:hypothetical protein